MTLNKCKLINNTADDSGTISLRPTVFKGGLSVIDSDIDDKLSLLRGTPTFQFKYVPGTRISFLRSNITGYSIFSSGALVDITNSSFRAPLWYTDHILTVEGGGVLLMRGSAPRRMSLQVHPSPYS